MASETLSVFAIVFYICLPINQKNKRQFNFLPLVKYLYFIFRITPTIDKEPIEPIYQKLVYSQKSTRQKTSAFLMFFGADDGARTRYLHLGKVALYQMSYGRILETLLDFLSWCLRSESNQ